MAFEGIPFASFVCGDLPLTTAHAENAEPGKAGSKHIPLLPKEGLGVVFI